MDAVGKDSFEKMKKVVLTLAIVFVCGIIAADICTNRLLKAEVVLSMDVLKKYAYSEIVFNDVIWNLFYERLKQFGCILLCRITPLRRYLSVLLLGILLFCLGFFMMSCVLAVGFVGIVIGIAGIFPHGLLYFGSYYVLNRQRKVYGYRQGGSIPQKAVTYLLAMMFFVTGCVMECVVGVNFIPWIIRLSMI